MKELDGAREIGGWNDESGVIEYDPMLWLRALERRYFKEVPPVGRVEVIDSPTTPGYFDCSANCIRLSRAFTPFRKSCQIILLHELIHSKLFKQNNDADRDEGARFKAEIARLWMEGAYADLL